MGGGDERPDDSTDGDEYEDREPDSHQVDLSSAGGGSDGGSGYSDSDEQGDQTDEGKSESGIVERIRSYGEQGNPADNGGGDGDGDGDGDGGESDDSSTSRTATLTEFGSKALPASRSLLALSGLGMAVGANPQGGESVVDMSEEAVEDLYSEAYREVNGEAPDE